MKINKRIKIIICAILALAIALGTAFYFVSCQDSESGKKKIIKKKVVKVIKSTKDDDDDKEEKDDKDDDDDDGDFVDIDNSDDDYSDDEDNSDDEDDSDDEDEEKVRRELPEIEDVDTYVPEYTAKSVKWDGPNGYTIVYAKDDVYAYAWARYLKAFFLKRDGVELPIVTDAASAVSKEILVGNTNRYKTSLSEQEFAVNLTGDKLIFEGGHRVMVEKAVKWFMSIDRAEGKVATLTGSVKDFTSTMDIRGEKYVYVWGDEFDGNTFDKLKMTANNHWLQMGNQTIFQEYDPLTTRVEEGVLKMMGVHYYDESNSNLVFAVNQCYCTGETMLWKYGYAEIRAKLPMKRGCWPAWWSTSDCAGRYSENFAFYTDKIKYGIEIDMFEVFSNATDVSPNLHKWFSRNGSDFAYNDGEPLYNKDGTLCEQHSETKDDNVYRISLAENNDYHVFGFLWTPTEMTMSVDGNEYNTWDLTKNFGDYDMSAFDYTYQHMIFNNILYVPGAPQTNSNNQLLESDLPVEYFVDYMRIYQLPNSDSDLVDYGIEREIDY